jgi:hypothetical protein
MRSWTCWNPATVSGPTGSSKRPTTSLHATPRSAVAYACPCCGYLTLDEAPSGTYFICEVCFWEDDGIQFRNPDYEGGANKVSLNQARENFHKYAVSETGFKSYVRSPLPEEHP